MRLWNRVAPASLPLGPRLVAPVQRAWPRPAQAAVSPCLSLRAPRCRSSSDQKTFRVVNCSNNSAVEEMSSQKFFNRYRECTGTSTDGAGNRERQPSAGPPTWPRAILLTACMQCPQATPHPMSLAALAMLKLKDWPPDNAFRTAAPRHNDDFLGMLNG